MKYLKLGTDNVKDKRSTIEEMRNAMVVIGHNSTLLLLAKHMGKRIYIVSPQFLKTGSREEQDIKLMARILGAESVESNVDYKMYRDDGDKNSKEKIGVPYLRHPEDTNKNHDDILRELLFTRTMEP